MHSFFLLPPAWDVGLLGFLSCDSIATKETNATSDISERNQSHVVLCRSIEPREFKDILIGFLNTWKCCDHKKSVLNGTDRSSKSISILGKKTKKELMIRGSVGLFMRLGSKWQNG